MAGTIADKLQALLDSKADIAAAIEERGGTVPDKLSEYGDAIRNLPEDVEPADVEFIDYDGTVLYKYTFDEANALSTLPALPTRTGFTNDGWNWTLAEIKTVISNSESRASLSHVKEYLGLSDEATFAQVQQLLGLEDTASLSDMLEYIPKNMYTPKMTVGCTYTHNNGTTEIDIETPSNNLEFHLASGQSQGSSIKLEWGDGTVNNPVGSQNQTVRSNTYSAAGSYTIRITPLTSGNTLKFGGAILGGYVSTGYDIVKDIRLGRVRTLTNGACAGFNRIESLSIPAGLVSLGTNVLEGCSSLKALVIPRSITSLSGYLFRNCASLEKVSIPATVTSIGANAFEGCSSLKHVNLTPYITSIGNNAFLNCDSLIRVNGAISTAASLGTTLFSGCGALESVDFDDGVVLGGGSFNGCRNLRNINQSVLTSIGGNSAGMFSDCVHFACVGVLSVATVPEKAFYFCKSLRTLVFEDGGRGMTIGKNAFQYSGVTTFDFSGYAASTPPTLDSTAFGNTAPDKKIIVPAGKLSTWQTSGNWVNLASFMVEA